MHTLLSEYTDAANAAGEIIISLADNLMLSLSSKTVYQLEIANDAMDMLKNWKQIQYTMKKQKDLSIRDRSNRLFDLMCIQFAIDAISSDIELRSKFIEVYNGFLSRSLPLVGYIPISDEPEMYQRRAIYMIHEYKERLLRHIGYDLIYNDKNIDFKNADAKASIILIADIHIF